MLPKAVLTFTFCSIVVLRVIIGLLQSVCVCVRANTFSPSVEFSVLLFLAAPCIAVGGILLLLTNMQVRNLQDDRSQIL